MKGMEPWQQIGKHLVRVQEDVVFARVQGEITEPEAVTLLNLMLPIMAQYGYVFEVVDARAGGGMSAEARRENASWYRRHHLRLEVVVFGANPALGTLLKLFSQAIRLLFGTQVNMQFVATEAEALAWVEKRRQDLAAGAKARPAKKT